MTDCPITGYFSKLDLSDLATALRNGNLTSVQITQASLACIEKLNPIVNAFCCLNHEIALKQAAEADRLFRQGHDLSPLQGIPIAIKDNIDTQDMITSMGSACFREYQPHTDADCVKRLKQLGAVIIGKTNTHEFAYGPTGDCSVHAATKNPWDLNKISGGSSSGSAVAVATGMVPCAIGTDTGGSIRIPAALTGVVGFKPSYATLSTQGVYPLSQSLDHLGLLAKNPLDISLLMHALDSNSSQNRNDDASAHRNVNTRQTSNQTTQLSTRVQSGHPRMVWLELDEGTLGFDVKMYKHIQDTAMRILNNQMSSLNKQHKVSLNERFEHLISSFSHIQNAEAYALHQPQLMRSAHLYQTEVLERLNQAQYSTGWQYVQAIRQQNQLKEAFDHIFNDFDFLLMPTVAITTPDLYQRYIYVDQRQINVRAALLSLTSPWNVLGFPVCSLPLGLYQGMPIGLQIIAPLNTDLDLLSFLKHFFRHDKLR